VTSVQEDSQWHLIAGSTGAGKSTLARDLVERTGGVRFAIDEWMQALYWMDCPEKNDFPWALERVRRCEAQIAAVAVELARAGVDAVLDLGFTTKAQRLAWLERGRAAGVAVKLHVLEVPVEERWERVCERNQGASATYSFSVSREMFDAMEAMWELPDASELAAFAAGAKVEQQIPDGNDGKKDNSNSKGKSGTQSSQRLRGGRGERRM
jgi:predicted kinase